MTKSVLTSQICHSRTGEINPVKVSNLVKLYVQRYKYFRKHGRKMDEEELVMKQMRMMKDVAVTGSDWPERESV